jgi:preprotein translocase SecE subunit
VAKADPSKNEKAKTRKGTVRKQQTVRERSQASGASKPQRIRSTAGKLKTPLKKAGSVGKKEYHLPLPDNRAGKILRKRVRLFPKFVREAWHEIRLVTWPNMRETFRLTMAVFIFSIVFAAIVGLLDYGLGKLFREVLLK